jgi:hypothetical protein
VPHAVFACGISGIRFYGWPILVRRGGQGWVFLSPAFHLTLRRETKPTDPPSPACRRAGKNREDGAPGKPKPNAGAGLAHSIFAALAFRNPKSESKENTMATTTTAATTEAQKIGEIVELAGLGAFIAGGILSIHHYAIAACIVGGAAAVYIGKKLRG